jgi:hypothetical protein
MRRVGPRPRSPTSTGFGARAIVRRGRRCARLAADRTVREQVTTAATARPPAHRAQAATPAQNNVRSVSSVSVARLMSVGEGEFGV